MLPRLKVMMSDTFQDAEHEQGMEELYIFFKEQFENEFIFDKVINFYKSNNEIVKEPLSNLTEAKTLLKSKHFTASFLHAYISIETSIKMVLLKPILFSLSVDIRATELLFKDTFKLKSIKNISKFYYEILFELSGVRFGELKRNNNSKTFWEELLELQEIRNNIVHQGIFIKKELCEYSVSVASFLFQNIIPQYFEKLNITSTQKTGVV